MIESEGKASESPQERCSWQIWDKINLNLSNKFMREAAREAEPQVRSPRPSVRGRLARTSVIEDLKSMLVCLDYMLNQILQKTR